MAESCAEAQDCSGPYVRRVPLRMTMGLSDDVDPGVSVTDVAVSAIQAMSSRSPRRSTGCYSPRGLRQAPAARPTATWPRPQQSAPQPRRLASARPRTSAATSVLLTEKPFSPPVKQRQNLLIDSRAIPTSVICVRLFGFMCGPRQTCPEGS